MADPAPERRTKNLEVFRCSKDTAPSDGATTLDTLIYGLTDAEIKIIEGAIA